MVYVIPLPFSYFGRFVKLYFQPSFSVTVLLSIFVPFASRFTTMLAGRFPSWLLLSDQVFVPLTSVVSGAWLFVILYPWAALPLTTDV